MKKKNLKIKAADQPRPTLWSQNARYLLVFVLLALIPLQALTSIRWKSATVEEGVHLAAGAYYLKTGDFEAIPGYPPLIRMWMSLPAWLSGVKIPGEKLSAEEMYPFDYGARFLYEFNDADSILFKGRFMVVALSLLLGLYVFRLTKDFFGWEAGIFSLLLYVFCPNILAHSRLATLDLSLTAFFFITLFYYRRAVINGGWLNAFLSGTFAFLTINTKYTGLVLFPVLCILNIFLLLLNKKYIKPASPARRSWKILLFVLCFSLFMINVEYGFRGSFGSINTYRNSLPENQNITESIISKSVSKIPVLSSVPLPVPYGYLRGLDLTIYYDLKVNHPNWYLGKLYMNGEHWWHYYPTAMALKLPVASLITISFALYACVFIFRHPGKMEMVYFIFIPSSIIFLLFSFICRSQLGLRLILPVFPFLFTACGFSTQYLLSKKRTGYLILSALMSWYIFSSISIYPHYLSYFNEIAGGPIKGIEYFADSNLDWGQDIKGLKKYMKEKNIKEINLIYYSPNGSLETNYYGIKTSDIHGKSDSPWAISATWLYYADTEPIKSDVPFSLKNRKPDDRIGYSINIYRPESR